MGPLISLIYRLPFKVFHYRGSMNYNIHRFTIPGEVAERLKAAVSKIVMGATPSGVRIPPSPPAYVSCPCRP